MIDEMPYELQDENKGRPDCVGASFLLVRNRSSGRLPRQGRWLGARYQKEDASLREAFVYVLPMIPLGNYSNYLTCCVSVIMTDKYCWEPL